MSIRRNVIICGLAAVAAATVAPVAPVALAAGGGAAEACGCAPAVVDTVPGDPTDPTGSSGDRTITVVGSGTVQVAPDIAVVNLGVQVTAPTGTEATDTVTADAAALTEALIAAGIAEEDIQTSGLSLYSTTGDSSTTVTGYNATLNVNVTVRDIEAVGSTIDAAQRSAGQGFTIGGVSFSFADQESVLEQARIDAVTNATAKAAQYAAAIDAELGDVVTIVESPSSPPIVFATAAASGDESSAGPPISPGQLDLTIQISATFMIR